MNSLHQIHHSPADWLLGSQFEPYVDAFAHYLNERRYSARRVDTYMSCVAHFARWASQRQLDIHKIDEDAIRHFLDDHLPQCDCIKPGAKTRGDLNAALKHLLIVLRLSAVIVSRKSGTTPVDDELCRFDDYMNHVRGLAPRTRSMALCTIRRLLMAQFGVRSIVISALKPEDVRQFIAQQQVLYSTPASAGPMTRALRGYFRFRAAGGDQVHGLLGVVSNPANWQLASLPKALCGAEVELLLNSLGQDGPSARRADAIVRCALDLGLRTGEITRLGLDDIDWRTGTVTLRRTKSGRQDVLPLPEATGCAIAAYLKQERPQTSNRAVFVRHIAPRDQPIGPDVVREAIRQAYARAGLPYTGAHRLRHTLASRLLEGGSSLKEVADVLRHRSLDTTLIYAKLDSKNLATVVLPWPGCAA